MCEMRRVGSTSQSLIMPEFHDGLWEETGESEPWGRLDGPTVYLYGTPMHLEARAVRLVAATTACGRTRSSSTGARGSGRCRHGGRWESPATGHDGPHRLPDDVWVTP